MMPLSSLPPPVIVIGMHRSGTTLLTRVIEAFGLCWGRNRDEYNEDQDFQALNEQLFEKAGARWDNPGSLTSMLIKPAFAAEAEKLLRDGIDCIGRDFLPEQKVSVCGDRARTAVSSWGWKDPRSTFTLPLWLKLFPEARVVHIMRNGMDVAVSVWKRETSRPEGERHPHYSALCQTLDGCFLLWKKYISRSMSLVGSMDNSIELTFEDLLNNTDEETRRLCDFLELDFADGVDGFFTPMNTQRANAFRYNKNPLITEFIDRVSNDPLLRNLGFV